MSQSPLQPRTSEQDEPIKVPPVVRIQTPGTPLEYRGAGGGIDNAAWRSMDRLVAMNNAILPQRCVKCNGTEGVRMKRQQFTWVTPWIYFTLFAGLLICLIIVLVLQKKATITYGMCARCRGKKMMIGMIAVGMFVISLAFLFLGIGMSNGWIALPSPFLFLGSLVTLAVGMPTLRPKRIDANGVAEFGGCGPVFLDSLDLAR